MLLPIKAKMNFVTGNGTSTCLSLGFGCGASLAWSDDADSSGCLSSFGLGVMLQAD